MQAQSGMIMDESSGAHIRPLTWAAFHARGKGTWATPYNPDALGLALRRRPPVLCLFHLITAC